MGSWEYLRRRAAVFLRDAAATRDPERRKHLIMLAARCQEMMARIDQQGDWTPAYPVSRQELDELRERAQEETADSKAEGQ
jgi:hypothetical protein